MANEYRAEGNQIFYHHPHVSNGRELFITIHPTADCLLTLEEQAMILAKIINERG